MKLRRVKNDDHDPGVVRARLSLISYRPGWYVTYDYFAAGPMLTFQGNVWDACTPTKATAVRQSRGVCPAQVSRLLKDDAYLIRTVEMGFALLEEHERKEWLRFRGERVHNPHPELTR